MLSPIRLAIFATAVLATSTTTSVTAESCPTAPYGSCGSNTGTSCCPSGFYCQPWSAEFFQCVLPPAQCFQQFTNVNFFGGDIKTLYGDQPSDCCTHCAETPGCKAYTFVNSNPGSPACYLKTSSGERRTLVGAVSGLVNGATTPPPAPACATPLDGPCGSSTGAACCPSSQYCQPWNANYYQCRTPPAQCSRQLTDMDFYGNDIKTVYVNLPSLCCDECARTAGCKAYTYINSPGTPVCYLKSATGTSSRLVGAISGQLN